MPRNPRVKRYDPFDEIRMVGAFVWHCPFCGSPIDYVPERFRHDLQKALLHHYGTTVRKHWRRCTQDYPPWNTW